MSLIHQALKKAQTMQRTDVLPLSGEEANGQRHLKLPTMAKVILPVLFLAGALFAGWWVIGRSGFLISPQTIFSTQQSSSWPAEPKTGGHAVAKSDNIISPSKGSDFKKIFEAAKAKNIRGMELYRQGNFSGAKDEFLSSIEISPKYAEAYNNLGLTYKQLGDIKAAEDGYKKALQHKPDYPEAMNNYGVALEAMGDSSAAMEYFKKAISIAPEYPDPYLNMAISLENDKRFDEAIAYYEDFLSLAKHADDALLKNVRERALYLNANNFAIENKRQNYE